MSYKSILHNRKNVRQPERFQLSHLVLKRELVVFPTLPSNDLIWKPGGGVRWVGIEFDKPTFWVG